MEIDSPSSIGISTGFGIPTGGTANQVLVKNSSTNYDTSWSSLINNQGSSGFIDIATVRIQWGTDTNTSTGIRTITLPASFGNTNYSVTANVVDNSDTSSRSANIGTRSTTNFTCRMTSGGNGSAAPFTWIAIGLKP